jgi:hypothetical protein
MNNLISIILTVVLATATLISQFSTINAKASSELLLNEDFSTASGYDPNEQLGGIFTGSGVDVVKPIDGYGFDSKSVVDLNGSGPGKIESIKKFSVNPGDTATLSFRYGGNFATACDLNYNQLNYDGSKKPLEFDESERTATILFGSVVLKKLTSSKPGTLIADSLTILSTEEPASLIFESTKLLGDPRCGVLITDILLTVDRYVPNGGTITIGGNTQSLSSISSSSTQVSSSSSSSSQQIESKGVLGFTTTAQEQVSSSANKIDPTITKILVSSELKTIIDSAKGKTVRTGGSDN